MHCLCFVIILVRSIASVSLRKSIRSRIPYHFDFFAISFNKDYSALYGGIDQQKYKSIY
jgi:glycosylphosphatidylinositol deacylase